MPWILLLLFLFSPFANAAGEESYDGRLWDLSLQTGMVYGNIREGSSTTTKPYGGFPFSLVLREPILRKLVLIAMFQVVVDLGNFQVSRQGIDLGVEYVLMGGQRRRIDDQGSVKVMTEHPWDISAVFKGGFHLYSAVNPTNANDSVQGSVYQTMAGISYRRDFGKSSSFYSHALLNVINFPSSVERISPSLFELGLGWRFYL